MRGGGRFIETDGDCFSETNRAILADSDIVVTNPPFSLFRKYMEMLTEWDGQFCVWGNMNVVSLRWAWALLKQEKMWLGASIANSSCWFDVSEDYPLLGTNCDKDAHAVKNSAICAFTNMDHKRRHEPLVLRKKFDRRSFPKYDNYDAVEVSKTASIPADYPGKMGVPISYMVKHCPEQFKLEGLANPKVPTVDGVRKYRRIFIRNRNPEPARKATRKPARKTVRKAARSGERQ